MKCCEFLHAGIGMPTASHRRHLVFSDLLLELVLYERLQSDKKEMFGERIKSMKNNADMVNKKRIPAAYMQQHDSVFKILRVLARQNAHFRNACKNV